MSWKALGWASEQKCEKAADKLILLALAERHNTESHVAYPSTAWLVEFSSLDRKTVLKSLERLQEAGLIIDSGRRMGSTGGVKAWQLAYDTSPQAIPKTGSLKRSRISVEAVPLFPEAVPKTGQLSGPKNGIRNQDIGTSNNRDRTGSMRERANRTVLPSDFTPDLTGKAAEIVASWRADRLPHELDAFRNYHLSKGSLMMDWQAAFRTWIGNAEKWNGRSGDNGQQRGRSRNGLADAGLEAIAERERNRFDR